MKVFQCLTSQMQREVFAVRSFEIELLALALYRGQLDDLLLCHEESSKDFFLNHSYEMDS